MALVCDDIKSAPPQEVGEQQPQLEEQEHAKQEDVQQRPAEQQQEDNDDNDLEDGEIEDDGDEDAPMEIEQAAVVPVVVAATAAAAAAVVTAAPIPPLVNKFNDKNDRSDRDRTNNRSDRDRRRHEDKKKHMTEAEKSILHLRKRERLQREKWEKFRKEQAILEIPVVDDFAINIEKQIASVLKKDKQISGDEEKDEEKRSSRKRRSRDKERQKAKQRKLESPPKSNEDIDESEFLNIRGGSPIAAALEHLRSSSKSDEKRLGVVDRDRSLSRSEESYDSEYSSDDRVGDRRERKRDYKRRNRNRDRDRDRDRKFRDRSRDREKRAEQQLKDAQGVCVFFLQGKCQKNDCPYSHEAVPPMKLELCKFYLMDCCAKGEKCSYMHSEFPCKFYHTGLPCQQGDQCKFAHGKPLSEGLKQILFKHIETAPREILGGFPRMSREEALNKINLTQQTLCAKYGTKMLDDLNLINNRPTITTSTNIPTNIFDGNMPIPPELIEDNKTMSMMNKPNEQQQKSTRNRKSRWQDPDPIIENSILGPGPDLSSFGIGIKPFNYGDQDMRITSNGDIDMRTLPLAQLGQAPNFPTAVSAAAQLLLQQQVVSQPQQDIDIRMNFMPSTGDVDIRQQTLDPRLLASKDVDIRQLGVPQFELPPKQLQENSTTDTEDEAKLQIDTGDDDNRIQQQDSIPANLPKTQRDLFLRIQAQQKDNQPEAQSGDNFELDNDINWYSDDDDEDENRLTIKDDQDDQTGSQKDKDDDNIMSPPQIKPLDVVEKLGDLSKIDISAEVTKLLTSISQSSTPSIAVAAAAAAAAPPPTTTTTTTGTAAPKANPRDPRQNPASTAPGPSDPRRHRQNSIEEQRAAKVSIYEQGINDTTEDSQSGRPDVDLRSLQLPFKGMLNYTPAKEIDASINSHPHMIWRVHIVDIPRPDYTGLKLSVQDAEKTGDPRLRKIFRLSTEEKDSPASPKASPKSTATPRIDPRLKKIEEATKQDTNSVQSNLSYHQQLTILQSSPFFQSLTSNQKLLLNQELASRNDNGAHDPVLNSLLTNLNLIPNSPNVNNPTMGAALNILASVNKLNNPMIVQNAPIVPNPNLMNQMAQSIVQPGLLGAAPGIPNLPPDFPINFDPRNGGLLGNAPPPPFTNFQQQDNSFQPNNPNANFDDFYPQDNYGGGGGGGGGHPNNRGGMGGDRGGFNRDRRRGRNFNRNNNSNRNFRNRNRSNRSHTPP